MDVVAIIVGFIIGVITVAIAIELGMRKTTGKQPASRPTHRWSLSEISNPRIIAEQLGDINLPKNARIVVNDLKDKSVVKGLEAKQHSGIRGNYILGDDRALILAGPIKSDSLGVWTVEKTMIDKLDRYFEDSWSKATRMKHDEDEKKP